VALQEAGIHGVDAQHDDLLAGGARGMVCAARQREGGEQ